MKATRRASAALAAALLCVGAAVAQPDTGFDFAGLAELQRLRWGSSVEDVHQRFPEAKGVGEGRFCLKFDGQTCFEFVQDKLERIRIRFPEKVNVFLDLRSRWGEPGRVEPGIDVVRYFWTREGTRFCLEQRVLEDGNLGSAHSRAFVLEPAKPK